MIITIRISNLCLMEIYLKILLIIQNLHYCLFLHFKFVETYNFLFIFIKIGCLKIKKYKLIIFY